MKLRWPFGSAAFKLTPIVLLSYLSPVLAQVGLTPVSRPDIDLSSLGRVSLVGDFDSISIRAFEEQNGESVKNGSTAVLLPLPAGGFVDMITADGKINDMCPFVRQDGTLAGIVVAGDFKSLGDKDAEAVALFDPITEEITPWPGVIGTAEAVLCDSEKNAVYVGGSFRAANSTNAIMWQGEDGWVNLPFSGFNAPVRSIIKAPNGHIVFGGSFTGVGNTTAPATQDAQVVNLETADISASASAASTSPRDILCPSNQTDEQIWALPENAAGFWRASMGFGYQPTTLRLYNIQEGDRGTKEFRFTAEPINGIMNLTYTNPETGQKAFCDATCPLAQNSSLPYQDFDFVDAVGMDAFQIDISDWYGTGGGLAGIKLFQEEVWVYAVDDFNDPACGEIDHPSRSSTEGDWQLDAAGGRYLTADASGSNSPSVALQPNIRESGNYSVLLYTPGCLQDDSCSTRGRLNVTASWTDNSSESSSTIVYQTNNYDKFDRVYMGPVDASSDTYRPSVTLAPVSDQSTVVAWRLQFDLLSSSGGLNGLFDYDPDAEDFEAEDFTSSTINNVGTSLNPEASIVSLVVHDNEIYAAGSFNDTDFKNIMTFSDGNATSLSEQGLDAPVSDMLSLDDFLYVSGNFTDTSAGGATGLSNVAAFSYADKEWAALGAGLNGPVDRIVPIQVNITEDEPETCVSFSGTFTEILATSNDESSTSARNLAIWVPSQKAWLENLDLASMALTGQLTASIDIPDGGRFLAGSVTSRGTRSSGAVGLESQDDQLRLVPLPMKLQPSSNQQPISRRDTIEPADISGIVTALFYERDERNVTVYGGHFTVASADEPPIENLLFVNGSNDDAISGLPATLSSNSTILALETEGDSLFVGGRVSANVGHIDCQGMVVYDLALAGWIAQPPALQGDDVVVNAIKTRPDTDEVYVGGRFDTAGALGCRSLCMFRTNTGQWNGLGSALSGTVQSLVWASKDQVVVAGNLTVGGNDTSLATYEPETQTWTSLSIESLPSSMDTFAPAEMDVSKWWAAGRQDDGLMWLGQYDGQEYRPVDHDFGSSSRIRGLQVLGLTDEHEPSDLLDRDQSLLITGRLDLPDFGNASAVLYDGSSFMPFILTSTADGAAGSLSQLQSSKVNQLKGRGI